MEEAYIHIFCIFLTNQGGEETENEVGESFEEKESLSVDQSIFLITFSIQQIPSTRGISIFRKCVCVFVNLI